MSRKKGHRWTKAERRGYANRPHPAEELESKNKVIDINSIMGWKPINDVEDFMKNKQGCIRKIPTKFMIPDDEPYDIRDVSTYDRRFIGGIYPDTGEE